MESPLAVNPLSPDQLRKLTRQLLAQVDQQKRVIAARDKEIANRKAREDKLTAELSLLRRYRFGIKKESFHPDQLALLDENIDADLAAIEQELDAAKAAVAPATKTRLQPKRQALPLNLPRTIIRHDPRSTVCNCGCQMQHIGDDVSERLDYEPGTFSVEQHVRSKWACKSCEVIRQEPVDLHIIDKGIPTTRLLAQVAVSKYQDHLPLYRQEQIFRRAGVDIPRSTLAEWIGRCGQAVIPLVGRMREQLLQQHVLHADETPVPVLSPGKKKTDKGYVWTYASTAWSETPMVVYDFRPTRAGKECRLFLQDWQGQLVCDDFSGYKQSFKQGSGVIEAGCNAHARRKFYEVYSQNSSPVAEKALSYIAAIYDIEAEIKALPPDQRQQIRQQKAKAIWDAYREWLIAQQLNATKGTALSKAIAYTLRKWEALTHHLQDGNVPVDNNWVENKIRYWAMGRKNWLFAGTLRSGQRAANIMTLIQSARMNGQCPYEYLADVLQRLPTIRQSQVDELLPHRWKSSKVE